MMKKVLMILMVLMLSFVFFGCGEKCEVCGEFPCVCESTGFDNSLPTDLKTHLGSKTIKLPSDTNFYDWYDDGEGITYIAWKDADADKWDVYFDDYSATVVANIKNARAVANPTNKGSISITGTQKAQIEYYAAGGTVTGTDFDIPSGTILLWYY